MTKARIDQTIAAHATAAIRAQKAGSDCVEVHALRLPNLAIPRTVEPPHRRVRRSLETARASDSTCCARSRRRSTACRWSIGSRSRTISRRAPYNEGRQIAIWAAQAGADAARHRRPPSSLPSAQIVPPMSMPDATFLHFAVAVKKAVQVPVIAVGRLGDPTMATEAVTNGATTSSRSAARRRRSAMGREAQARRADPTLPRLQHLHQRDARRARIGCVVNGAAGRETLFRTRAAAWRAHCRTARVLPAVGASLVADGNEVMVFEKAKRPGGAFRYAGKALLFQEVEANEKSFERMADLAARVQGVTFPFRHQCHRTARAAGFVRPHRDRDRRAISLRPGPIATTLLDWGPAAGPACPSRSRTRRFVTILVPGSAKAPRSASSNWPSPARPSSPSATRCSPARASRPSPARSRRRCWDDSHSAPNKSATVRATIFVAARKSLSRRFSFALWALASRIERGPAP